LPSPQKNSWLTRCKADAPIAAPSAPNSAAPEPPPAPSYESNVERVGFHRLESSERQPAKVASYANKKSQLRDDQRQSVRELRRDNRDERRDALRGFIRRTL